MPRSPLTDEEYALIEPLLPASDHGGGRGRPFLPHRKVLEAIFWIHRTGAPWRDLPEEYGNWSTVYERFRCWREQGLFARILATLESAGRKTERIDFEFSAVDGGQSAIALSESKIRRRTFGRSGAPQAP
jgi:transposase